MVGKPARQNYLKVWFEVWLNFVLGESTWCFSGDTNARLAYQLFYNNLLLKYQLLFVLTHLDPHITGEKVSMEIYLNKIKIYKINMNASIDNSLRFSTDMAVYLVFVWD